MIWGIGSDIIRVSRIRAAIERRPERFLLRVLTAPERAACAGRRDGARYAAKRFAAKEAFAKALGTGFRRPATLGRISVLNDPAGRPYLAFDDELRSRLDSLGIGESHVTISDDGDWSFATVILARAGRA